MEKHFADLKAIRENYLSIIQQYDLSRLTFMPLGFRNNIFWNAAHAVVTQQLLHYYLSDNEMLVSTDWVNRFKKGTKGDASVTQDDLDLLIDLIQKTPNTLEKDYQSEKLAFYRPYETSFGVKLENIEDAIRFNNVHEGLHLGYIMALSKSIN